MPEFQLTRETREDRALWGELSDFERGYIEAAAFCGLDEEEQLERFGTLDSVSFEAFAPETIAAMAAECHAFLAGGAQAIIDALDESECAGRGEDSIEARAGRDFWYTRNGHGVGYWEPGRWPDDVGAGLDRLAKAAGGRSLYFGDDGLIYQTAC